MTKIRTIIKYSALCMVVLIVIYQYRGQQVLERQRQLQEIQLATLQDSVATYKTRAGELYQKVQSIEIERRNLKEALETSGVDIKRLKEQNIRWRDIVSTLRAELESAGQGTTTVVDTFKVVERDTIYFQTIKPWTNDYLTLYDMEIQNKQLDFSYRYKVELNLITEQKRKSTIVTATINDPYARITTGNSITVVHKKRFWERPIVWGVAGFVAGTFID